MATDVAEVVTRYYRIVGDLRSSEADLESLLHPRLTVVEHPNPVTPRGATRDLTATLHGFRAGKALLSEQSFELRSIQVDGPRAAVQATWRGTVGVDNPRIPRGTALVAEVAAFLEVADGRILHHETYDCYSPWA